MPGDSITLNEWLTRAEQKQTLALDAVNAASQRAKVAAEAVAGAQSEAASCYLLLLDVPAYAICEQQAEAAVVASTSAVDHYNDSARTAAQAYKDISSAIETLHELLSACQDAEAHGNKDDSARVVADGRIAHHGAEAVSIPDVSDHVLDDARKAIAELRAANEDAQQIAMTPFI